MVGTGSMTSLSGSHSVSLVSSITLIKIRLQEAPQMICYLYGLLEIFRELMKS